jgi:cytochrome c-type biogenesis protein CcmH
MFRSKGSPRLAALALVASAIAFAQVNPLTNPRVRRLGDQLRCQCPCGSTVTGCNMLHCESSEPMRARLLEMVNAGMSDGAILDAFAQKYGKQILEKPPAEGFNLLGYLMPFIGIALGLAFVWWIIQRFRRPLAVAGGPAIDDETLARYQARIDKDLEKLD